MFYPCKGYIEAKEEKVVGVEVGAIFLIYFYLHEKGFYLNTPAYWLPATPLHGGRMYYVVIGIISLFSSGLT